MTEPGNGEVVIGGISVAPGEHRTIDLPVAPMYTHDDLSITVKVMRGNKPGPILFVCAALHGDEISGVEIISRMLQHPALNKLRGTLLAIPIVNVYGFLNHTRYLPDGRDLNRSFPGSTGGSLAARVANTFLREIVLKSTHGIDLHTGARHRTNFPQIRADLNNPENRAMTEAFGVPLVIDAKIRDGSLRDSAGEAGIPVILYEAGESLRFEEMYIHAGLRGIINVMRRIGMLPPSRSKKPPRPPIESSSTHWIRAPASGILRTLVPLGGTVTAGQVVGTIADPLGLSQAEVTATGDGVVIGRTNLPLVYEGDAIVHVAEYGGKVGVVERDVEAFQESHLAQINGSAPDDNPVT